MSLTENYLLDLSDDELDELFRKSPAGEIPDGDADGKVLVGSEARETSPTRSPGSPRRSRGRARSSTARRASSQQDPAVRHQGGAREGLQGGELVRRQGDDRPRLLEDLVPRRSACATRSARSRRASTSGSCSGRRTRSSTSRSSSTSEPRSGSVGDAVPARPDDRRAGPRRRASSEVESLLATMGDGVANGSVLDFGALDDVHFARLIMVAGGHRPLGRALPPA